MFPQLLAEKFFDNQKSRAAAHANVGDVKCGPVPPEGVKIEKVDDKAQGSAIEHIAQRTGGDQNERCRKEPAMTDTPKRHETACCNRKRNSCKKDDLPTARIT